MADRLILLAAGLLAISGVPGLFLGRRSMTGQRIALGLSILGAIAGLAGSLCPPAAGGLSAPWPLPGAAIDTRVDALAVVFLLPVFLVTGLSSIFGMGYWRQTEHIANGRKLRLFSGLLAASMVLVIIARNGVMFLFAWEVMTLATYFLVTTDDDASARRAGWIYLVAAHVGALALFALFAAIRALTGSFALDLFNSELVGIGASTWVFVLALVGFGIKAGIMPFHVWLPAAHASAPSHVSALLSGVLLKVGVYGLVRVISLVPQPPVAWGAALLALGVGSGVIGIVFALAQHDLKRLLAYCSIENIGVIFMGLGLAMIGRSMERADWVVLGLAGALLHVWNHALFKSLLFFGAGSVIHVAGTREIDRMGGLARHMPVTAFLFTIGAIAICGLPPLNGFVSELFVYIGLFRTLGKGGEASFVAATWAVPALALIGGLALACFIKVIGAVFLGQPRQSVAAPAHEPPASMLMPMAVLAACCAALGVAPFLAKSLLQQATRAWVSSAAEPYPTIDSLAPLASLSAANGALILLSTVILIAILGLARRRRILRAGTWDCGFAGPSPAPRVQYTASSLSQMLVALFGFMLRPRQHRPRLHGPFPHRVSFKTHVDELVLESWILPLLRWTESWFARLRVLQHGRVQLYILYVLIMLILLLVVTFPFPNLLVQLLSR